jgi:hypothetical protein
MGNPDVPLQVPAEMPEPLQMVQLLGGFQVSQALYAVAELGVATVLLDGSRTVQQLAAATGSDAGALGRVVRFLATLGVFRISGTAVEVTGLGATLAEGSPGSVRDVALYWMQTHYAPFGQLLHTVRTGETAATRHYGKPFFEWLSADPGMVEVQNNAMAVVTNSLRAGMFDGYRLPEGNLVADIGGADGSMICRLLAREPSRRAIVFDRPEVVPAARKVLDDRGLPAGRRSWPGTSSSPSRRPMCTCCPTSCMIGTTRPARASCGTSRPRPGSGWCSSKR